VENNNNNYNNINIIPVVSYSNTDKDKHIIKKIKINQVYIVEIT
jgi:hypothetical protein